MELTKTEPLSTADDAKALSAIESSSGTLASMSTSTGTCSTEISGQILASVWRRSLPLVRERLLRLNQAAQQSDVGLLSAEARVEASDIAHKLAGSLGMFGYGRGTEIARELEVLLEGDAPVSVHRYELLVAHLGSVLPL